LIERSFLANLQKPAWNLNFPKTKNMVKIENKRGIHRNTGGGLVGRMNLNLFEKTVGD